MEAGETLSKTGRFHVTLKSHAKFFFSSIYERIELSQTFLDDKYVYAMYMYCIAEVYI